MPQGKPASVPDDGLTTRQRRNRPLVVVHTGEMKGKSTAAFGLALRCWTAGRSIGVFQFVKSAKWRIGEQTVLERLGRLHDETGEGFSLSTQGLVLATGYAAQVPAFLDPVRDRIAWDERGRYVVSPTYAIDHGGSEIFVQNAEEHTHGFVAPDLGMGAYRNSVIIAAMTGREVYPIEKRIAVQEFGVPDRLQVAP